MPLNCFLSKMEHRDEDIRRDVCKEAARCLSIMYEVMGSLEFSRWLRKYTSVGMKQPLGLNIPVGFVLGSYYNFID